MWNPGILVLLGIFAMALAVCIGLVLTQRWHGKLTLDHDLSGVQKLHKRPVPRIGGVALFMALLMGGIGAWLTEDPTSKQILLLLVCSLPAFLAGLIEDLTKRVSIRTRLYASFASVGIAIWFLDAQLVRLDTPILDTLVTLGPISMLFTCFAVGGMTNAINIIDGLNGLAAGCVSLMLAGLATMAWQVGDVLVIQLCLGGIAALVGFLILNFPFGRIFLGDGGAYLAGFWLAECGILLLKRNPQVSTWAVLLCCLYPVWETLYSMYRRQVHKRAPSGHPDMVHMHHLVYKFVASMPGHRYTAQWRVHGLSSMIIWSVVACLPVLASLLYTQTYTLMACSLGFVLAYNLLYKRVSQDGFLTPDFDHQQTSHAGVRSP